MVFWELRKFPRNFTIVNTMELLERGAYYGVWAILSVHVVYNLGYDAKVAGLLNSFMFPLLYFVPIVAAVFGQKYGFKKMLTFSFALMICGYFLFSISMTIPLLFVSALIMGIGAGCFKPQISATISHVTSPEDRNKAFSIFYWMINFGSTVSNILIWFFVEPEYYRFVFVISGTIICVNLLILLTMFKDPVKPQPELSIFNELTKNTPVLHDRNFLILLLIYPGFWIMYAQHYTALALYMVDYRIMPMWFTASLLAAMNPGTIIISGPFLTKFVEKYNSLHMMIFGMMVAIVGFFLIGFFRTPAIFIMGIVVFSVGEYIVHPNFIAYTSRIAPKDKVTQYMGWIFLPSGIGLTIGGSMGGFLYAKYGEELNEPSVFWSIICAVGFVTIAAFIIYNLKLGKKLTQHMEDASVVSSRPFSMHLEKPSTAMFSLVMVPIVLMAGFSVGAAAYYRDETTGSAEGVSLVQITVTETFSGTTQEGSTTDTTIMFPEGKPLKITATISWSDDEAAGGPLAQNEPDTFHVTITCPMDDAVEGAQSDSGSASATYNTNFTAEDEKANAGDEDGNVKPHGPWTITVSCDEAGDIHTGGPLGVITWPDSGNAWTLEVTYDVMVPEDRLEEESSE